MQFNTFEFLVFFTIVLCVYWLLSHRQQNAFLLVASYVFYGWWDWRFLFLLFATTVVDFYVGLALGKRDDERARRRILLGSLVANLGVLALFKYYGFFVDSAVGAFGRLGIDLNPLSLEIILPVGVSFYTFQSMSYTIDVYRKRMAPCRSLLDFSLFVSFFPQLVAGPIERATRLLPQIEGARQRPSERGVLTAVALIVEGLLRKVVIADLAAPVVNRVFALGGDSSWNSLIVATLAFGLQIYGDFSGYSAIARGTARLLGIELMHNFREPYLARNITEFWRRWHISLSSWLRDYLYVPLGGNRRGRSRTYLNLLIVMLLGGLWHGAALTFVVWGAVHGLMLAGHKLLLDVRGSGSQEPDGPLRIRDLPAIVLTFGLVHVAWIFFRAEDVGTAFTFLRRIVTRQPGFFDIRDAVLVAALLLGTLAVDLLSRAARGRALELRRPLPLGFAVGMGLAAIVIASGSEVTPFIYFQF